jgi:CPA1 family monovalent cation:H+ antiporter
VEFGTQDELVLLGVLVAVAALLVLALPLRIPYPILLVVGGLALGFVPGLPEIELPPDVVLVVFLPPLLYSAAFFTSLRDLRANLRPITTLAVGLVLATMVAVAVVAHAVVPDMSWEAAFVLGAIVSPTDAIAATAIARRIGGVPRRVVTIVEGESLLNDGTALVLYNVAVAAVVTGTFSVWEAGLRFVLNGAGGIAIGLAVGYVVRVVRRKLDHPPTEITISLMTGYFAYLPAEALHVSGVLAAVTAGIYLGWHAPELITVRTRLQGTATWEIVVFVANAALFVLVGLTLPTVLDGLHDQSTALLLGTAAAVSATVIAVRIVWMYALAYVEAGVRRLFARDRYSVSRVKLLVGWMGMRGAVSLAAALALPFLTDSGAAFNNRDMIIFLAFSVILVTLVLQGLTLPALIRVLRIEDDGSESREEVKARIRAAEAALVRMDELAGEAWVREDTAERMRGLYTFRRSRFSARFDDGDDGAVEEQSQAYQRLRRELLDAERNEVVRLRNEGVINDEVMYRVTHDLDLEDARLDV